MLDLAKQKEMAQNVRDILDLHQRKDETYLEIIKLCLRHLLLLNAGPLPEIRKQRAELIEALTNLIKVHDAQKQTKQAQACADQTTQPRGGGTAEKPEA